jgi:Outer membrane protein beta-barrel domain
MNKLLLTISLALLTIFSFAQTFNLGVKAGANLSTTTFNTTIPSYILDTQNKTGFQVGFTEDINFQNLTIQPGLFFITKGEKFTGEYNVSNTLQFLDYHQTGSNKFNYLEVPVNVLYKMQASSTVKIHAGGGPYIGYALTGSTNMQTEGMAISYFTTDYHGSLDIGSDKTKDEYKLFDYGANFITGIELKKHYTIDLNYSLGLRNIVWAPEDNTKNRSLGLSVGYLF